MVGHSTQIFGQMKEHRGTAIWSLGGTTYLRQIIDRFSSFGGLTNLNNFCELWDDPSCQVPDPTVIRVDACESPIKEMGRM